MTSWTFGVEIEAVLRPHTLRLPLNCAEYYSKLAAALRRRGLKAKADDLQSSYSKRADHYDKWWITRDGSLGTYDNAVALEAVSPILDIRGDWEQEIDTFWKAARAVFHMPDGNTKCGSHIHIAPGRSKRFKLETLKKMAYGIAIYEPLLLQLLVPTRADNQYCRANRVNSSQLRQCQGNWALMGQRINSASDCNTLKNIMQDTRYVIWNFANTVPGKSGTIEFRAGRLLKGEVRTKRWITFTVCFLRAVVAMNDIQRLGYHELPAWTPGALYDKIKNEAVKLAIDDYLPGNYTILNETSTLAA